MEFRRPTRRRPLVNMTNMVDVMLLLLIFFVVSTSFLYGPAIVVNLPESERLEVVRTGAIVVTLDAQGDLFLDGIPIAPDALTPALAERMKSEPDKSVVIEADRQVPYGQVVGTVDAVVGSGVKRVVLPTVLRRE